MAGTNCAFAQEPSCGEQAYVCNIGSTPLGTAQLTGAVLVAVVVAFAAAWGIVGRHHNTSYNLN